ncbi:MAG TPA: 30S ribosome-binding factor RbfA [Porticoccaceae bacterium]|nr:30S ribosome-binding factor RbfA [Porticoccaceae bacterium]|tara:strand:- start:37 stop:423 length:387 start_codon:yes stop_codon:yes gene_type:complete
MPREFTRSERVADAVRRELSVLLREAVRDPRIGMASITELSVSRDLATCKAYVSFVGDYTDEQIKDAMTALGGAAGYLRSLLAGSLKLRTTPKITFIYDDSGIKGQRLSALIDRAIAADAAVSGLKEP